MSRAKIDLSALKAVARPQPNPVEVANRDLPPAAPRLASAKQAAPAREQARQASRIGKAGVQFWTQPETHKKLKLAALELDRTVDDIVNEAVAQWLRREDRA